MLSLLLGRDARFFCDSALSFLLDSNARLSFGSTARLFSLALSLLLGREAGFLLGSTARLFGLALSFLLGRKAGLFFVGSAARLFGLTLGFLLSREAGFRLGSTESLLLRLEALALFVRSLERRPILARTDVFGGAVRALAPSRPPQCAHHDDHDRGCERETEPTDDQKHLHDWGRSPPSCLPTVVHFPSRPRRVLSPVSQGTPAHARWPQPGGQPSDTW